MKPFANRLYRIHTMFAGILLLSALICLPKFIAAIMDYTSHDARYSYAFAKEASDWARFIIPAGAYGLFFTGLNARRTERGIAKAKPSGFKACYEIRHGDKYVGISSDRSWIVVVDMECNFSTCQPLGFVQTFSIQQVDVQSELSIRFNSFEYPCMKIRVKTRAASAIAAQLSYALHG